MPQTILIVGGGFGGVTAAVALAKKKLPDTTIQLLSKQSYITYNGALYRVLRGQPVAEVCIPLQMIVPSCVEIIEDTAEHVDAEKKTVKGKNATYRYTHLILAPGSEPAYFGIKGMDEHSLGMMTIAQTLHLRAEIISCIEHAVKNKTQARFVVIGAGPTGIEIAGEVSTFGRTLIAEKGGKKSQVDVDLIEAADRVLPITKPFVSRCVQTRLESLGVRVHTSTMVSSVNKQKVECKGGNVLEADRIMWTAGVKPNALIAHISGFSYDKRGRVEVDSHLRAKGHPSIFVIGDCASTPYAGMAQTAVGDGTFVADVIEAIDCEEDELPVYTPRMPAFAIPAGPKWAAVKYGIFYFFGFIGSMLRRLADLHVYMLILPLHKIFEPYFGWIPLEKYGITFATIEEKEKY